MILLTLLAYPVQVMESQKGKRDFPSLQVIICGDLDVELTTSATKCSVANSC